MGEETKRGKQAKTAFLEILGESQAASAGANLTEKFNHAVYRKIQALSTVPVARSGGCFNADVLHIEGLGAIARKDLAAVLKRLVRDRMIVQLVSFESADPASAVAVIPFFLARPQDKPDALPQIYAESIQRSAAAFERFMAETIVSNEQMQAALTQDLASETTLPAAVQSVLLDVRSFVNVRLFDVLPDPDMIDAVIGDIETDLGNGRAAMLAEYGLLKMVRVNPVERFELISEFFIERVIPKYRSRGNCRKELAQIAAEEAIYQLDPFAPPSVDFRVKRALEVRKAVQGNAEKGRFAGALPVEAVIALAPAVKEKYLEAWQAQNERTIDQIKKALTKPMAPWKDLVAYFDQKQISDMDPSIWNRLVGDAQLLYGAWELPRTTMHFLVRRSSQALRAIVRGMTEGEMPDEWQVLAMKDVVETYEDYFRDLFAEPEFVSMYGMLLRRAYFPHMPWYLRLLARFNIKTIQDMAFQSAKDRIVQRQRTLEARNRERYVELLREKEEDRLRRARQIRKMTLSNRIIEKLDRSYLGEGNIATIGRLREDLPDVSEEDLHEILKTARFQIISSRSDAPDDRMILYPLDYDWKNRSKALSEAIAKMEKKAGRAAPNEAEQKLLDRIGRLRAAADKPAPVKIQESDLDPYMRLEKEIRKHRKSRLEELPEFEY